MRRCLCCHRVLVEGEDVVCLECLMHFPLVNSADEQNPLWKTFCGQLTFEHATTLAYYQPGGVFAKVIVHSKFGGWPEGNAFLTRMLLDQLEGSGWPYDIDVIMPVPIHWIRLLMRGYNQVSPIVHTLGKVWHVPVESRCLSRAHYVKSQLKANAQQRKLNQQDAFRVRHPERLAGKHVLLVDDVCTTGATLVACAEQLQRIPGVRISFLTLALTFRM